MECTTCLECLVLWNLQKLKSAKELHGLPSSRKLQSGSNWIRSALPYGMLNVAWVSSVMKLAKADGARFISKPKKTSRSTRQKTASSTVANCKWTVTPKGVLPLALCHASATLAGPWASSRGHCPKKNWCDKQSTGWWNISCHTDKNRYYTWS